MSLDALAATLSRAAVGGLEIPVVGVKTAGGMDAVAHVANLKPAADHELTGRRAYEDTWRVPFLTTLRGWGDDLYPTRFEAVVRLFEMQHPGEYLRLLHPLFGTFPVVVSAWSVEGAAGTRSGVWVEFSWKEQADSASLSLNTAADEGADTLDRARAADEALAKVGVAASFAPDVKSCFAGAAEGTLLPADQVALLVSMERRARGVLALPSMALGDVAGFSLLHAAVVSVERLLSSLVRWRRAASPDPSRVRVYVTPREMTPAEVSLAVYRSLDLGALVRLANPIADAVYPAGARLTINPR